MILMKYSKFFIFLMRSLITFSVIYSSVQICLQLYKTKSIETELLFVTISFILISLSLEVIEAFTDRGAADAN